MNPPIAARRAQWVVSRRHHTFSHSSIIKSEQVRDTRVIDLIILKEISSIFPSRQSFRVRLTYRFLGCHVYACRAHVALALSSRKGVPRYNRRLGSQRLCFISRHGLKNSYGNFRSNYVVLLDQYRRHEAQSEPGAPSHSETSRRCRASFDCDRRQGSEIKTCYIMANTTQGYFVTGHTPA